MADRPSWLRRVFPRDESWADKLGQKDVFDFVPTDTSSWPIATFSPGLAEQIQLYGIGPSSYAAIYRSQPSVYTVVEFLAWQVSQIGLKVYHRTSDTDREHLTDNPISRILHDPAPGLTYERFMHRTVADLCIFGNSYWLKLDRGTRIIVPLPVIGVTPKGGNVISPTSYQFKFANSIQTFPAEQVVHFRRYNPDDLRVGVSPLEPLRKILDEEAAAGANRTGFWRNAARQDAVVLRPKDAQWSDEARKRFRLDLQNKHSGAANAGKWMVLEDGMDVKPISFSPKDSEFIEGRKLTLETVARAFNIPLSVLGLTETSTYASQKEFHKALYQDTLGPWAKMLEGEIQMGVVPWFTADPDIYVEFNLAEKLKGSFEEQAEILTKAVGGPYMTRNEGRARLNLPRIDDPAADELVVTNNMIGAEDQSQLPPGQPGAQVIRLAESQGDEA